MQHAKILPDDETLADTHGNDSLEGKTANPEGRNIVRPREKPHSRSRK
ncbi:MAG: hypothetical protein RR750_08255 [Citrobacter sp.]